MSYVVKAKGQSVYVHSCQIIIDNNYEHLESVKFTSNYHNAGKMGIELAGWLASQLITHGKQWKVMRVTSIGPKNLKYENLIRQRLFKEWELTKKRIKQGNFEIKKHV